MVQLIYIGFYNKDNIRLAYAANLSVFNWFYRNTAGQYLNFITRTSTPNIEINKITCISTEINKTIYNLYIYADINKLICTIVTDCDYQKLVVNRLILNLIDTYLLENEDWDKKDKDCTEESNYLKDILIKKPEEIDKLTKISNKLEEVKEIINKNIETIIERGEKIEDLVKRSKDLDDNSKRFANVAKKMRCCRLV